MRKPYTNINKNIIKNKKIIRVMEKKDLVLTPTIKPTTRPEVYTYDEGEKARTAAVTNILRYGKGTPEELIEQIRT